MGEANLKLTRLSKSVNFSVFGPRFFESEDPQLRRNVLNTVIVALVKAKFPQGMGRTDGKVWAAWQEILTDEKDTNPEMVLAQIDWLRQIAEESALKIDMALANAREALIDYLVELSKVEEN